MLRDQKVARGMVPGVAVSEAGPDFLMHYVYLLRSAADSAQTYVGYTTDLKERLRTHQAGGSMHTRKYRPWNLTTYLAFTGKVQALAFERYLKSHSGQAFATKRLWPPPEGE